MAPNEVALPPPSFPFPREFRELTFHDLYGILGEDAARVYCVQLAEAVGSAFRQAEIEGVEVGKKAPRTVPLQCETCGASGFDLIGWKQLKTFGSDQVAQTAVSIGWDPPRLASLRRPFAGHFPHFVCALCSSFHCCACGMLPPPDRDLPGGPEIEPLEEREERIWPPCRESHCFTMSKLLMKVDAALSLYDKRKGAREGEVEECETKGIHIGTAKKTDVWAKGVGYGGKGNCCFSFFQKSDKKLAKGMRAQVEEVQKEADTALGAVLQDLAIFLRPEEESGSRIRNVRRSKKKQVPSLSLAACALFLSHTGLFDALHMLLRNDSLLDISTRITVYGKLVMLLRAIVDHESLRPLLDLRISLSELKLNLTAPASAPGGVVKRSMGLMAWASGRSQQLRGGLSAGVGSSSLSLLDRLKKLRTQSETLLAALEQFCTLPNNKSEKFLNSPDAKLAKEIIDCYDFLSAALSSSSARNLSSAVVPSLDDRSSYDANPGIEGPTTGLRLPESLPLVGAAESSSTTSHWDGSTSSAIPDSSSSLLSGTGDWASSRGTSGVFEAQQGITVGKGEAPSAFGGDNQNKISSDASGVLSLANRDVTFKEELSPLLFGEGDLQEAFYFREKVKELKEEWGTRALEQKRLLRIAREIASLSTTLPIEWGSMIALRVDNARMDVLKALVVGPEGTPYQNGLFFFDILLPSDYPNTPPKMRFLTTGAGQVRFNPNLYESGKVCLSLLGTWDGPGWNAEDSTLLQLLVSVQSLVLNAEPYYNEPGFADHINTPLSDKYNAPLRTHTLRHALLPAITHPPAPFADLLKVFFHHKAEEIKTQCKAWADMAPEGVWEDVEAVGKEIEDGLNASLRTTEGPTSG
eukprot:TRINITY_DN14369_c0_g1_i2.p1 TRINITY_DN14369_c0_g1~~TRINITY_DN14369_c0_g1_i2.p1  ORF type:complete len:898 (-),score=124.65 TRINITY_DN14369_c0_g1_i2:521-3115(-)